MRVLLRSFGWEEGLGVEEDKNLIPKSTATPHLGRFFYSNWDTADFPYGTLQSYFEILLRIQEIPVSKLGQDNR
jgi:hypothetical protein